VGGGEELSVPEGRWAAAPGSPWLSEGAGPLTASRRFTFCASRRLARPDWGTATNERFYGPGCGGRWGSGENYQAFFVFAGAVDAASGMLLNLSVVKQAIDRVIDGRYDHRFLNLDTPPFDALPPTPENLAARLLDEARQACSDLPVRPVACHLAESPHTAATAYVDGRIERHSFLEFSAARSTRSPFLSETENRALFGAAASAGGHGHGYRLRVTLAGGCDEASGTIAPDAEVAGSLRDIHGLLDHRNLNLDVPELAGRPTTTECLAAFILDRLRRDLPVSRVRLHETPRFFAEAGSTGVCLGLAREFSAAHCLSRRDLSPEDNLRLYGKCANPNGHGHRYAVEATIRGALDARSGTLADLGRFEAALTGALAAWDGRHLDRETDDFRDLQSTGENIVLVLWPRLGTVLPQRLSRLRLQETENNRFALRAAAGA
jgi:6-pyruvoyltetrahydropterin/6-carboxytetrahydropterin synthase